MKKLNMKHPITGEQISKRDLTKHWLTDVQACKILGISFTDETATSELTELIYRSGLTWSVDEAYEVNNFENFFAWSSIYPDGVIAYERKLMSEKIFISLKGLKFLMEFRDSESKTKEKSKLRTINIKLNDFE